MLSRFFPGDKFGRALAVSCQHAFVQAAEFIDQLRLDVRLLDFWDEFSDRSPDDRQRVFVRLRDDFQDRLLETRT